MASSSSHKKRYTVTTLLFFAFFILISIFIIFTRSTRLRDPSLFLHPPPLSLSSATHRIPNQSSSAETVVDNHTTQTQSQPPIQVPHEIHNSVSPNEFSSAKTVVDPAWKQLECDLYMGTWVKDEQNYPIYQHGSCPYVDEAYDCQINGRTDNHYSKWRWKPHGCDLPRYLCISIQFLFLMPHPHINAHFLYIYIYIPFLLRRASISN